jgi:membrane associated rhomboid family serine protease
MSFGVLRKSIDPTCVAEIAGAAVTSPNRKGCACPMCSLPMTEVAVDMEGHEITLDVCQACAFVWFDSEEYELLPPAPPPSHILGEIDMSKMSPEAREKLAMAQVQEMGEQSRAQDPVPDEAWKALPALLGLPVELDEPESAHTPWATYFLSLLIAVISIAAFSHLDSAIHRYGLIPSDTWRDYGLTLITSFYLHGGWVHLLGNLYFLLVFGRAVERELGPWKWLLLIFVADQTGNFLEVLGDSNGTIPTIGASGGISGLLAYYAFKFPHVRLGLLFRFSFFFRWIQLPAWTAFAFWILFQIYGAWIQLTGHSDVASMAHLGGAAPGIFLWWIQRKYQPVQHCHSRTSPCR